jgi:pilus assembly protein TadC
VIVAIVAAALAVLLWPDRVGVGVAPTEAGELPTEAPATVDEAATALGLVAAALRSGVGAVEALEAVAEVDLGPAGRELAVVAAAHRWGRPTDEAWAHVGAGWAAAAVAWHAAHSAGAAPAGLLSAAATRMRAEESRRVEAVVQRAGVLLVLPLGACFLPGFVATTVAPVVLHLLGGVAR